MASGLIDLRVSPLLLFQTPNTEGSRLTLLLPPLPNDTLYINTQVTTSKTLSFNAPGWLLCFDSKGQTCLLMLHHVSVFRLFTRALLTSCWKLDSNIKRWVEKCDDLSSENVTGAFVTRPLFCLVLTFFSPFHQRKDRRCYFLSFLSFFFISWIIDFIWYFFLRLIFFYLWKYILISWHWQNNSYGLPKSALVSANAAFSLFPSSSFNGNKT